VITFYFGLKRPEAAAQAAFFAVEQPGSRTYRHFLSARRVAARYGAGRATKTAFLHVARQYGCTARVDPPGVFARITGPVDLFERVFRVRIRTTFNNDELANLWVPGRQRAVAPAACDARPRTGRRAVIRARHPVPAHCRRRRSAGGRRGTDAQWRVDTWVLSSEPNGRV
jgi:hypothetical protein